MNCIYQLGIWFYRLAASCAAPFSEKAKQWSAGQKQAFPYLKENIQTNHRIIWIHAASLGEFEQGRPLIEQIKNEHPEFRILLTFFSPSGYEIRKDYEGADYICYLPADTKRNAKKFVRMVNPEMVFFIKYEFWKNYFSFIKEKNIPLYMVSAIFRKDHLFFKQNMRGKWYRKLLNQVDHFFVQNKLSADLLEGIGLRNITITGDTRFDRVAEIAKNRKDLPLIEEFKNKQQLIIAGSSWEPDENLIADFATKNPTVKIIFAPHEIKESNIKRLEGLLNEKAIRYSTAEESDLKNSQVLIIDSIGLLSSIYRYANIAYIGGGFGVGIHNTLEAAIYNIPIIFGPNYQKFQEAVDQIYENIAFSINNEIELNSILGNLLSDEKQCKLIAEKSNHFMNQNIGATHKIMRKVFNN